MGAQEPRWLKQARDLARSPRMGKGVSEGPVSTLRKIAYGTLPTKSYLAIVCEKEGLPSPCKSVEQLHSLLSRELRTHGATSTLSTLLERLGFEWAEPERML